MSTATVSIIGQANGQQVVNVLHAAYIPAETDLADLAAYLLTNLESPYTNVVGVHWTGIMLKVREVGTTNQYEANLPWTGQVSGDPLPPQAAAVLSLRTSVASRHGRGRMYVPAGCETQQSGGVWIAGYITNLTTLADFLLNPDSPPTGFHFGVYSKKEAVLYQLTAVLVRSIVYTQRRRTVGVGV